jgi:hypothetical protein
MEGDRGIKHVIDRLILMNQEGRPADVIMCASKGGHYMQWLWKLLEAEPDKTLHGWKGASVKTKTNCLLHC